MTTITIKKPTKLKKTQFEDIDDLLRFLLKKQKIQIQQQYIEENIENYELIFDKPIPIKNLLNTFEE